MQIQKRYLKRKYRTKKGPAPIFQTIDEYFTSGSFTSIWEQVKGQNPILIFLIRKPSGMVEKVLIKNVKEGINFDLVHTPPKPIDPNKPIVVKPTEEEKEKLREEIRQLREETGFELEEDIGKILPPDVAFEEPQSELPPYPEDFKEKNPIPETGATEPMPEPLEDTNEVDIKPGDKLIIKINGQKGTCEIVSIFDAEGQLLVKLGSGKLITIEQSDIVSLA